MSYIKLDRKILDWEWYDDDKVLRFWIYCLCTANVKGKTWQGKTYIPRGSFVTSLNTMVRETRLSERNIRTCISKLKRTGEITVKSTNKNTMISIVKYDDYQTGDGKIDMQSDTLTDTQSDEPSDRQTTTTKEVKKIRRQEDIDNTYVLFAPSSNESKAVAKIPLNVKGTYHYVLQEDIDHYKELYPAVDVEQQIRSMVGWCEANPNNRKTRAGVKRFITNWLNKAQNSTRAYSERNKSGVTYLDI